MEPITLFQNKKDCTGCGACAAVCPKQAIQMTEDEFGELYPRIDADRCVACGLCHSVCVIQADRCREPLCAYAALGKQTEIYENGASGGVFGSLAYPVMADGGAVAGAVLETDGAQTALYHRLSAQPEDVVRMQGSKYAQSDATECYKSVIDTVKTGKTVLFSGTPCQVQAVKNLTDDPENLITVDLICHGVPPVKMLGEFLTIQQKRLGGEIRALCFRDKSSRKPFTARFHVSRGERKRIYRIRSGYLSYYRYFLEGTIYRESCYSCPYAKAQRAGDLTIGDYWGIEKFHADQLASGQIPSDQDISCLFVNSEKGQRFLQKYGKSLQLWQTQPQWIAQTNRQLQGPSQKPSARENLRRLYKTGGYRAVEQNFIKENGGRLRFAYRWLKMIKNSK